MKKLAFAFVSLLFLTTVSVWIWIPSSKEIKGCMTTSMYSLELCPTSKNYVPLSQISKNIQNSILLTEDSSFYIHSGFDQDGIERCFEKMKEKHHIVCGGSTITQQLAKNMFLYKEKNFFRKGLEALVTVQIEKTLSKKAILERYLNIVQFGKNVFGVRQAAEFYFKKSPANLTVQESAFLAMVLPNPEKYSQSYYRKDLTKFARRRLSQIIESLYQYKRISADDFVVAMDGLDSFLKVGQSATPAESFDALTTDDFENMEEIN